MSLSVLRTVRTALATLPLALAAPAAFAQTDLLGQLEQDAKKDNPTELVQATFKSTRLINGHTIETPGDGTFVFLISHRFGPLNSGAYEFFGLDQATLRLGFEYALSDRLEIGVGRSSYDKTFDGFLKYRALRQSTGAHAVPVSVTLLGTAALSTTRDAQLGYARNLSDRMAYTYQALIARKFSSNLSLQLMPSLVHYNLIPEGAQNDVFALGGGGRYKLTRRFSVNAEYYALLSKYAAQHFRNSVAVGVDIETGGHIFQLHVTNSQGMIERQFITETTGNFFDGYLCFGFNMSRNFTIHQRRK